MYFGHDGYRDFYWVSRPDSLHSVNVEQRPAVNAVIYDSSVQVGDGRAVYVTGTARRVDDAELEERCEVAFRPHLGGRRFRPAEAQRRRHAAALPAVGRGVGGARQRRPPTVRHRAGPPAAGVAGWRLNFDANRRPERIAR